jgi:hypothetical protein
MTNVRQAVPLNGFYQRAERSPHPTVVGPRTTLPAADLLTGAPAEVLDALHTWAELAGKVTQHDREAAKAAREATAADDAYRTAVRDAIASGGDPAKVKNDKDRHEATAAAHRDFSRTVQGQLTRHGHVLGALLDKHAEVLCDLADAQLEEAAEEVRRAVDQIGSLWLEWAAAYGLRSWASGLRMGVMSVPNFHGDEFYRGKLVDVMKVLTDTLAEPDRLRSDERVVTEWRDKQQAARAHNAAEFGSN